ncbi:DNA-binding protein YbaB [Saccharopolyspora lacisalsi]|uniref:DNA-binding protein YbaB n=1 Tax=Halosaccharopolyspora lacisalsi TaxID=1000566 RepID=A0A839DWB0_9PSEU|nr:YbaB/EbfC family nucleoid-associated protein [Halosaccharopolyspora lacisalsi]MBA8824516.1 DNA-binding protein YbaB [Halosaccharopolyspora lacisalsi]
MTTTGSARRDGISVEVAPGGALRSLELEQGALRLGGTGLARAITAAVDEATEKADQAAAQAMKAGLDGVSTEELSALGLGDSEATTSATWRY